MITAERLREVLNYDPETGVFTWRLRLNNRAPAGSIAGCFHSDGYVMIRIDRCRYYAHRLAWFYVHGRWPSKLLDHKNHDPADNRVVNLREASHAENGQNRRAARGCIEDRGAWNAYITHKGKQRHLGRFPSRALATEFRDLAKAMLHPFSQEAA